MSIILVEVNSSIFETRSLKNLEWKIQPIGCQRRIAFFILKLKDTLQYTTIQLGRNMNMNNLRVCELSTKKLSVFAKLIFQSFSNLKKNANIDLSFLIVIGITLFHQSIVYRWS